MLLAIKATVPVQLTQHTSPFSSFHHEESMRKVEITIDACVTVVYKERTVKSKLEFSTLKTKSHISHDGENLVQQLKPHFLENADLNMASAC